MASLGYDMGTETVKAELIEYMGKKVAGFVTPTEKMICVPQVSFAPKIVDLRKKPTTVYVTDF